MAFKENKSDESHLKIIYTLVFNRSTDISKKIKSNMKKPLEK